MSKGKRTLYVRFPAEGSGSAPPIMAGNDVSSMPIVVNYGDGKDVVYPPASTPGVLQAPQGTPLAEPVVAKYGSKT